MGRTLRKRAPEQTEPEIEPGTGSDSGSNRGTREAAREARRTARAQRPRRSGLGHLTSVQLLQAAHPRQALVTALVLATAAALSGRRPGEVGLVLLTVLTGQVVLGWHNDLVDRERDQETQAPGKPVADGRLDPGTVWFALACAVLLLVPLAVANGVIAASAYLVGLAVALLGNVALRGTVLSWLPWAVQFGLYPAFLSYGGYGGAHRGDPPEIAVTVLAALLGVGVHVLRALPGLVPDNRAGLRHLPLRIALRIGAPRLLLAASLCTGAVAVALLLVARAVGIAR